MSTFTENTEDQQDLNFSQDNNVVSKKQLKHRNDYSNTKVKTRNLLTNVSYKRFKQFDFNKDSFVVDILSFLVQNFNPVNLDVKLDTEKERETIKFLRDECIPNEFVQFIYKQKYYNQISQPNLTYQKAHTIVKEYLFEDLNRINQLKYKLEEKFNLIHYVYSLLFSKIYNRTNTFGINKKNNFKFHFQTWKARKNHKFLKQMSFKTLAKDPSHYEGREVDKNQQVPIEISHDDQIVRPTTVYEITSKQQADKRKILENRLNENTEKMRKMKKK